jgi:general secretion pathway protein L
MTLQDVLNSEMDFNSLLALARQGLVWWLDELAALLPPAWRARLSSRPRVLAEQAAPGEWRFFRDGHGVAEEEADPDAPIGVLLPPSAVLTRRIRVPRMATADVRRMVGLDIDRLSPLSPDLIHFDMEVVDRDAGNGQQTVLVGIVTREDAAAALDAAERDGLNAMAMGTRADGDSPALRFDFLPAARLLSGRKAEGRARRYWWWGVLALLAVNLVVLVARDMIAVQRLRDQVDAQSPIVNTVLALRRRVGGEERRRSDMIARGQRSEPLRLLDTLTQAVPQGAWAQHLEWNGQTLRLVGFRRADVDMVAALRGSGAFTNIRTAGAEGEASATALVPFDITADARPPAPQTAPVPEAHRP